MLHVERRSQTNAILSHGYGNVRSKNHTNKTGAQSPSRFAFALANSASVSAPPPSMAESVLAWERDQFGPGGKPPTEAMSSDEEPEVVVEEDLVDEGAE